MRIQLPDLQCTGCGACLKSCPKSAISMREQEDGFAYPKIDNGKCISCGQCVNGCHILNGSIQREPIACYAAQIRDKAILQKSTSGGIFYAMAKAVLSNGGTVYGCIYDETYHAIIDRAETLEQLAPMHGSKYLWSDPSRSYELVKKDLKADREVLYTGLPCQIAGLKKYLGKDDEHLLTVDVLCGGAPSPYAFQRYLETLTDEAGKRSLNFNFRDKNPYGSGVHCTYTVNGVRHNENYLENSFYFAFSSKSRITWRESCYSCKYKCISRISDMTIGDYWGVEEYHQEFIPSDGVSVIMINTEQGERLFNRISSVIDFQVSKTENVLPKNSLVSTPEEAYRPIPKERDAFFRTLRETDWKTADKRFLNERRQLIQRQRIRAVKQRIQSILGIK